MIKAGIKAIKGEFVVDADLEVPSIGITALIGPSGSGKTTILRTIAGLERHPGSCVSVGGSIWQDTNVFLPPHKRSMGFVFQEPSLFPHLTVRGNIAYGVKRLTSKECEMKVRRAAERLGLIDLLDRDPSTLSGGENQRVAIARALAVGPSLLLMDEPVSSLDAELKNEVLAYIDGLREELDIPIVYVSHSADEVARIADHLILLNNGRVTAHGPIRDVLTRLDLPLARGEDAEAIVEATVAGHDDEFGLSYLDFPGGRFTVPRGDMEDGQIVRLRVLARDVSLTLEEQKGTSILNIFEAVVEETADHGISQVTVRVSAKGVPLLARVTRKSASVLDLRPGRKVFAQAKSVAVLS